MEFGNDKNASRTKMVLISIPFMLLLGTGLLAIFQLIGTWIPTIVSGILVLLGWSITVLLKLKSVKFRFIDDKFAVLYYPVSPMTSNFKKIEIASDQFVKYEIKKSWMGLKKDLILYEIKRGEEACYPPVSITICGKETIRKLEECLSAYKNVNP